MRAVGDDGREKDVGRPLLTIAFATDPRYMCLTAAAAWTALDRMSHDSGPVSLLLFATEVSDPALKAFERAIRSARADVHLRVIDAHAPEVREMAARTRLPMAQFLRLYVPRYVEPAAERVIFLDSDVLVKDDLSQLFTADLAGKTLGAVLDFNYPTLRRRRWSLKPDEMAQACWRAMPDESPYFNAGVQLIDVAQWRAHDVESRVVSHILRNASALPISDQDALVQCLKGQWQALPMRWNMQTIGRFHMPELSAWGDREVNGIRFDESLAPGVLHYNGSKPIRWGVSPRGRTRVVECSVARALAQCGYYSPLGGIARKLELHLRGTARSGWLGVRRLGRSLTGLTAAQPAGAPGLLIHPGRLSLSPNGSGVR